MPDKSGLARLTLFAGFEGHQQVGVHPSIKALLENRVELDVTIVAQ